MNRIQGSPRFVANKRVSLGGHDYTPGDPIDVSGLPDHKVSQLLRLRILRPYSVQKDSA